MRTLEKENQWLVWISLVLSYNVPFSTVQCVGWKSKKMKNPISDRIMKFWVLNKKYEVLNKKYEVLIMRYQI